MAGFGFSLGDIALVSQFAWKLYKSCKNAGPDFCALTDVARLQNVIHELSDEAASPTSLLHRAGLRQQDELDRLMNECQTDLRSLETLLSKYKSLKTSNPRTRDQLKFSLRPLQKIQSKLSSHREELDFFLTQLSTSSLGRIETNTELHSQALEDIKMKLDQLRDDVLSGRKDPAILEMIATWDTGQIGKELIDDSITQVELEENKPFILEWLKHTCDGTELGDPPQSVIDLWDTPPPSIDTAPPSPLLERSPSLKPTLKRFQATVEDAGEDSEIDTEVDVNEDPEGDTEEVDYKDDMDESNPLVGQTEPEERVCRENNPQSGMATTRTESPSPNTAPTQQDPSTPILSESTIYEEKVGDHPQMAHSPKCSANDDWTSDESSERSQSTTRQTPPQAPLQSAQGDDISTVARNPKVKKRTTSEIREEIRLLESERAKQDREFFEPLGIRSFCEATVRELNSRGKVRPIPSSGEYEQYLYETRGLIPRYSFHSVSWFVSPSGRVWDNKNGSLCPSDKTQNPFAPPPTTGESPREYAPYYGYYPFAEVPLPQGYGSSPQFRNTASTGYYQQQPYNPYNVPSSAYAPQQNYGPSIPLYMGTPPGYQQPQSYGTSSQDHNSFAEPSNLRNGRFDAPGGTQFGAGFFGDRPGTPTVNPANQWPHFNYHDSMPSKFTNQDAPKEGSIPSFANVDNMGGARPGAGSWARKADRFGSTSIPKATVVERPLPVTLEEVYNGTVKRMRITRKTYDLMTGKSGIEHHILSIPIKRGLNEGRKIRFNGIGDRGPDTTQDIRFIVKYKEHIYFKCVGDELRYCTNITLDESLFGWNRVVPTIEGKNVSVARTGLTPPTHETRFPGLGLPRSKKPTERGDFVLCVNIQYPNSLSQTQREKLRAILRQDQVELDDLDEKLSAVSVSD